MAVGEVGLEDRKSDERDLVIDFPLCQRHCSRRCLFAWGPERGHTTANLELVGTHLPDDIGAVRELGQPQDIWVGALPDLEDPVVDDFESHGLAVCIDDEGVLEGRAGYSVSLALVEFVFAYGTLWRVGFPHRDIQCWWVSIDVIHF